MRARLVDEAIKAVQDLFAVEGLSQHEFAERCGVSQPTISRILSGTRVPDLETLESIISAFDREVELVVRRSPR